MATATKLAKRGTVTPALVEKHQGIFHPKDGWLADYNVEREEQIELLGIALVAASDPLLLGAPGVGKTWLIEGMLNVLETNGNAHALFNTLVFKETPADDIIGPRSLPAMKAGRIERLVEGYLPTSVVAYVDEFFKASPTLVNSLLDIMANRRLKVGKQIIDCSQLLCMFTSSNEISDREDMLPVRDRIGMTNVVPRVKVPENQLLVAKLQDKYQADAYKIDTTDAPKLTMEDIAAIRGEVSRIVIPDTVFEALIQARDKWYQKNIVPSDRRIGQILMAMKARAWGRGDGEVNTDDMIVGAHMAWNEPDDADAAREVVLEFANVFARKAARMKQGMEPILAELSNVQKIVNEAGGELSDDALTRAHSVQKKVKLMMREANEQVQKGDATGHDTSELKSLQGEMGRALEWIKKTLIGEGV